MAAGIGRERLVLDPGIGFGKRLEHNLALLAHLPELGRSGLPLLIGVSRKSMFQACWAGRWSNAWQAVWRWLPPPSWLGLVSFASTTSPRRSTP